MAEDEVVHQHECPLCDKTYDCFYYGCEDMKLYVCSDCFEAEKPSVRGKASAATDQSRPISQVRQLPRDFLLGLLRASLRPSRIDLEEVRKVMRLITLAGYEPAQAYQDAIADRPDDYDPPPPVVDVLPSIAMKPQPEVDERERVLAELKRRLLSQKPVNQPREKGLAELLDELPAEVKAYLALLNAAGPPPRPESLLPVPKEVLELTMLAHIRGRLRGRLADVDAALTPALQGRAELAESLPAYDQVTIALIPAYLRLCHVRPDRDISRPWPQLAPAAQAERETLVQNLKNLGLSGPFPALDLVSDSRHVGGSGCAIVGALLGTAVLATVALMWQLTYAP